MATLPTGPFQNAAAIFKGLLAMGLNFNAAAGVAGNIYQESHGDPRAYSSAGGGLFGLTIANGGSAGGGSLSSELAKLKSYIMQNGGIARINSNAKSPAAAAQYFSNVYERPGTPMMSNRTAAAQWIANAARSGHWGTTTPAASKSKGGKVATTPASAHSSSNTTTTTQTPASNGSQPIPAQTTGFNPGSIWNWLTNPVGSAESAAGRWVKTNIMNILKRFGFIFLGGILIVVGLIILARPAAEKAVEVAAAVPK